LIIKTEVFRTPGRVPRNIPCFDITNLDNPPQTVYESYCWRSDVKSRPKELYHGLETERARRARFSNRALLGIVPT